MRKTKTSTSSEANTKRNEYAFSVDTHRRIEISSNFENGNISLVKQVNELYVENILDSTFSKLWMTLKTYPVENVGFILRQNQKEAWK